MATKNTCDCAERLAALELLVASIDGRTRHLIRLGPRQGPTHEHLKKATDSLLDRVLRAKHK